MLGGIGVALNALYAGLLWARLFPPWFAGVTIGLDALWAIALLIILREHSQLLLPLMLFPVLMASVRFSVEAGLIVAFSVILAYGGLSLAPLLQAEIQPILLLENMISVGASALVLFGGGIVPAVFIRQRVQLARQENETELESLRVENARGRLISEMALTLSSTLDYRKVLRTMVDLAFSAMAEVGIRDESAIGMVLLFDDQEQRLAVAAGRNIARTDQGRLINSEEGLIGHTIRTAEATVTNNVPKDKGLSSFASLPGCRSAICAPLRAGFNTYGVVLFCSTETNFYTNEHKKLLTTFCSQAIIALQNAQLFDDIHHEQQRILEKESEARRKLARDLHDGPTQSIAAIAMRLNFIKMVVQTNDMTKAYDELVKVEEIAQRTTNEIRTMLFAMRPVILETQGLIPALNQYAERLNANESFQVRVINRGYEKQLNADAEGVVFAIVEEAVGNAKKHAQATHIAISLMVDDERVTVEVKDNGVGFDVESTQSSYDQRSSLGLINMDERAQLVGGHCTLQSKSGKGTAVQVEIPIKRIQKQPQQTTE